MDQFSLLCACPEQAPNSKVTGKWELKAYGHRKHHHISHTSKEFSATEETTTEGTTYK